MPEHTYEWFVEPGSSTTNEAISGMLDHFSIGDECCGEIIDNNGVRHVAWGPLEHRHITFLRRSSKEIGLNFSVFNRMAGTRVVRQWMFKKPTPKISPTTPCRRQKATMPKE